MTQRFAECMSDADSLMWTIERDPILRSTVTAVSLLDGPPDWDRVVRRLERAAIAIPRLRQRVREMPFGIARPDWVDSECDLGYHMRRIALASTGTLDDALEIARVMAIDAFDVTRPLWEFVVVENLEQGRAALIQKFHHTVTDGVGGVQLAMELLDQEPHPDPVDVPLPAPKAPTPPATRAAMQQWQERRTTVATALPTLALAAAKGLWRDPRHAARTAAATGASAARMVAPVSSPMSTVLVGRSQSWSFRRFDVSLDDLRVTAKRTASSINDVFVTGVVGGLTAYHDAFGARPTALRMTMPVNLRTATDPLGGNRFTPLRFVVPVDSGEADQRIRRMSQLMRTERDEPALALTPVLAAMLNALPASAVTSLFGGMLKNVDFVATNVAGIPFRCWFGGAEVLRQYAFAPPSGAALNVALLSHGGIACIGVVTDNAAVTDPDLVSRCIEDALGDLVSSPLAERHAS